MDTQKMYDRSFLLHVRLRQLLLMCIGEDTLKKKGGEGNRLQI